MTARWNFDKPHRCPACYAVTVTTESPRWWRIYTCCRCGLRFTRWPRLARLLSDAGVCCEEHATVRDGMLTEAAAEIRTDAGLRQAEGEQALAAYGRELADLIDPTTPKEN